jgi:hypothetical protein
MPHTYTYTNILIHALFSTKDRQPSLAPEIRDEAFCYLGGTINELGLKKQGVEYDPRYVFV